MTKIKIRGACDVMKCVEVELGEKDGYWPVRFGSEVNK